MVSLLATGVAQSNCLDIKKKFNICLLKEKGTLRNINPM